MRATHAVSVATRRQKETTSFEVVFFLVTRTGICSALQGFRHGSGGAMLRTQFTQNKVCGALLISCCVSAFVSVLQIAKKEHTPLVCVLFLVTRTGIEPMFPA